jgi:hypothetical protein
MREEAGEEFREDGNEVESHGADASHSVMENECAGLSLSDRRAIDHAVM